VTDRGDSKQRRPADGPSRNGDRRGASSRHAPWKVHPAPDGRGGSPRKIHWRLVAAVGVALLLVNYWIATQLPGGESPARISYTPFFLEQVRAENVKKISSRGDTVSGRFRRAVDPPGDEGRTTHFTTEVPTFADDVLLSRLLVRHGVVVDAESPEQGRSFVANLFLGLLPTVLLISVLVWIVRRSSNPLGGFRKSRAHRADDSTLTATFADVAGIDEAKDELAEIVDFLRDPQKYRLLGARIPRGVLLSGAPGTGKTLLARAVAGEAGAPFFSASAAEFIELIVGVGASRVRDLFEQAKKAAPAIIFIDELDAIGRSRSIGMQGGGQEEREQTLNQILTEMDGFAPTDGVIVLAATNRPEILDRALLRPGRFDRRIAVQAPDSVGRREILEVHTRSIPLAPDVDLQALAATTPGMVGADLANLVNEAALVAARRGHDRVSKADLADAVERVVLGAERKLVMSGRDRERTAYHEAGHAIVGMLTPDADPVRKVSIIPRGMALGVTLSSPESDRFAYDREYLMARIKILLGGRVAEQLVYGTVTTGAEDDLRQLTAVARKMVARWGMSEAVGSVFVDSPDGEMSLLSAERASEATHHLVDQEVRRIVEGARQDVTDMLHANRERLDALVAALLQVETLDEAEAYAAAGVLRTSPNGDGPQTEAVVAARNDTLPRG
jgi:cell division protease FtsH